MSINQNPGQFKAKQVGKQGSEPVGFPTRYQPSAASAPASARTTPDPTAKPQAVFKHPLHYPPPLTSAISGQYPGSAVPLSKHHPGYPIGYPPPGALRLVSKPEDPARKLGEGLEGSRARSADDTQRQARSAEEEQHRRSADMLKFAKRVDGEGARASADQRRQMQGLLEEIKSLKEENRRLAEDNRELRDLCCFLDDDRQKGRKLAREWQRFGRYTASVMRQEVSAYQSKLRELDDKQQELIRDNLELKELCLYLDEERGACAACGRSGRDDGDGSSSGTNADEASMPTPRALLAERTVQYVRDLEQKVKRLEEEKAGGVCDLAAGGRPEAVVRALQVLEVRERLERERRRGGADMDDGEQALVREMCNVVWGKLEDGPPPPPPPGTAPPR